MSSRKNALCLTRGNEVDSVNSLQSTNAHDWTFDSEMPAKISIVRIVSSGVIKGAIAFRHRSIVNPRSADREGGLDDTCITGLRCISRQ